MDATTTILQFCLLFVQQLGGYNGGGGVSQGGGCDERDQTPQPGSTVRYAIIVVSRPPTPSS